MNLTPLMVIAPEIMEVTMFGTPSLVHDHALSMYIQNIKCRLLHEEKKLGKSFTLPALRMRSAPTFLEDVNGASQTGGDGQ
ncbi:hypothetical protein SARC_09481 [Sphaeroforma arctica JP610]|uniref:Uncharacterized protein n=1 Tax=Sphaeroforma arctica JP610 TaxID=667725 RepID=A0A0L0FQ31_9EUKA|nr:hypothetical protein SARC_09481 [Sphaeroforma arctica JP610]KNC78073.1 hypothetical protein SARC_09481 [Sphaeroforma arctica JP610]|eukprot:XP_014151975.1 hypothetical protein SARC_09481 [Sphaeroforma arctica JP610]